MPHDRKNQELKPGDRVTLQGVVTEAYAGQTGCNLVVQPDYAEADPDVFGEEGAAWRNTETNWKGPVTLNAHWVEKAG